MVLKQMATLTNLRQLSLSGLILSVWVLLPASAFSLQIRDTLGRLRPESDTVDTRGGMRVLLAGDDLPTLAVGDVRMQFTLGLNLTDLGANFDAEWYADCSVIMSVAEIEQFNILEVDHSPVNVTMDLLGDYLGGASPYEVYSNFYSQFEYMDSETDLSKGTWTQYTTSLIQLCADGTTRTSEPCSVNKAGNPDWIAVILGIAFGSVAFVAICLFVCGKIYQKKKDDKTTIVKVHPGHQNPLHSGPRTVVDVVPTDGGTLGAGDSFDKHSHGHKHHEHGHGQHHKKKSKETLGSAVIPPNQRH